MQRSWLRTGVLGSVLWAGFALAQQPGGGFTLNVPVKGDVPTSVARMRSVLATNRATFQTADGLEFLMATIGSTQVNVVQNVPTLQQQSLSLTCADATGNAERVCRDLEQQYLRSR